MRAFPLQSLVIACLVFAFSAMAAEAAAQPNGLFIAVPGCPAKLHSLL